MSDAHIPAPPAAPARVQRYEHPTTEEVAHLRGDAELETMRLDGTHDLAGIDLARSSWERVILDRARMSGASLEGAVLADVMFDACDLSNVAARSVGLRRVAFTGTRATGMGMSEASLVDVEWIDARLDMARMRFARLERVAFRGCDLRDADLSNARLSSVTFEHCDMSTVDLTKASFERCELRSCVLEGVRGLASLSGVAMSLPDVVELAPSFARALGVHVLDPA